MQTAINARVTIRTKEADLPSEFPPARLYLDDIEEIVRILLEATQTPNEQQTPSNEASRPRVTLTTGDRVCDGVQELPQIAKKTTDLSIRIETEGYGRATYLALHINGSLLSSFAITADEQLRLYYKLAPIFKRRNRWLATLIHSHSRWSNTVYGAASAAFYLLSFLLLAILALPMLIKPTTVTASALRQEVNAWYLSIAAAISGTLVILLASGLKRHTIIILRPSSEPSPVRQGLRDKLPAALIGAALGSVLTFLLTLLGLYLKHKYWP
jgi:hypothetical protein